MAYWPEDNQSTLKGNEFDKRCHEVFIDDETEVIYCGIIDHKDGWATVYGTEASGPEDPDYYYPLSTNYVFDMTGRPQALDYLLGNRDDFND